MSYAQISDMILRYGETELLEISSTFGGSMDTINANAVNTALAEASDEIDGYLRERYVTPVATPTPKMTGVACALARYALSVGGDSTPAEKVSNGHKSALSWLRSVKDGKVTLNGELLPNTSQDWSQVQTRAPALGTGRFG